MSILNVFNTKAKQPIGPQRSTTYNHIVAHGGAAEQIHALIKLAKKQGVRVSGGYKHSWLSVDALNVTFSGPANVVDALNDRLADMFDNFHSGR